MIDIISGTDSGVALSPNTKRGSKAGVVVALLCLLALAAGGSYWVMSHSKPAAPAVDLKASEQAVRDANVLWSKAAQAHDVSGVLSYYAVGAAVMPPNEELLTKKPDLLKSWSAMLDGNDVSWKSVWVESAKSGELVYDVGTYTLTTKVKKGKPVTDRGKYMAVWKKQADGSWKADADIWNSDLPVAAKKK